MLTEAQVAEYRETGYIVVENVLSAGQLAQLRAELDKLLDRARSVDSNDDVFDLEDTHTRTRPRVRRIKTPHKHARFFHDLVRSRTLLDLVTPLLGPNVRLQNSKLNLKSAGYGAAVEWHQDWAYYPYTNDDVLALGVMIDAFDEENGPMMVVPGSHKGPVYDHHAEGRFCGGMDPTLAKADFAAAKKLLGAAGSVSLHHARAIHGSDLNRSGKPRSFLLYELCAADAWPLAGGFAAFSDFEEYESRMLCGVSTIEPRLERVPVRMPLPKPLDPSSLYQAQKGLGARYFGVHKEAETADVR